jgi:amino acid transporter
VKTFGMIGITQTLGLIIVYCMGNIGAIRFYGREKRDEFNVWLHLVVPVLTTAALIWVFWKNVETLHPFSPKNAFDYSPLIVIIWTVVGLAIVFYASRTGKEDWLRRAGESVQLRAETAAEAAHRPVL